MAREIEIRTYARDAGEEVRAILADRLQGAWLEDYVDPVFQICDELIKNAVKSNYKFLLIWSYTRRRIMDEHSGFSRLDANEWLREAFYSGESRLLEGLVRKLPPGELIGEQVRRLLDLENRFFRTAERNGREPGAALEELLDSLEANFGGRIPTEGVFAEDEGAPPDRFSRTDYGPELAPLLRIKELARELEVQVRLSAERNDQENLITVTNDSPILDSDMARIRRVRSRFQEYHERDAQQDFFLNNLDTSGGGHGLGYAIMDLILQQMELDPERSLYLIAAERTMVLLVLPRSRSRDKDAGAPAAGQRAGE